MPTPPAASTPSLAPSIPSSRSPRRCKITAGPCPDAPPQDVSRHFLFLRRAERCAKLSPSTLSGWLIALRPLGLAGEWSSLACAWSDSRHDYAPVRRGESVGTAFVFFEPWPAGSASTSREVAGSRDSETGEAREEQRGTHWCSDATPCAVWLSRVSTAGEREGRRWSRQISGAHFVLRARSRRALPWAAQTRPYSGRDTSSGERPHRLLAPISTANGTRIVCSTTLDNDRKRVQNGKRGNTSRLSPSIDLASSRTPSLADTPDCSGPSTDSPTKEPLQLADQAVLIAVSLCRRDVPAGAVAPLCPRQGASREGQASFASRRATVVLDTALTTLTTLSRSLQHSPTLSCSSGGHDAASTTRVARAIQSPPSERAAIRAGHPGQSTCSRSRQRPRREDTAGDTRTSSIMRGALASTPAAAAALLVVSTAWLSGVQGHVYNETLDPWNLNKNQRESRVGAACLQTGR